MINNTPVSVDCSILNMNMIEISKYKKIGNRLRVQTLQNLINSSMFEYNKSEEWVNDIPRFSSGKLGSAAHHVNNNLRRDAFEQYVDKLSKMYIPQYSKLSDMVSVDAPFKMILALLKSESMYKILSDNHNLIFSPLCKADIDIEASMVQVIKQRMEIVDDHTNVGYLIKVVKNPEQLDYIAIRDHHKQEAVLYQAIVEGRSRGISKPTKTHIIYLLEDVVSAMDAEEVVKSNVNSSIMDKAIKIVTIENTKDENREALLSMLDRYEMRCAVIRSGESMKRNRIGRYS